MPGSRLPFISADPDPIITHGGAGSFDECGVVAPTVAFEDGRTRLWFHGFGDPDPDCKAIGSARIAYAETDGLPFR